MRETMAPRELCPDEGIETLHSGLINSPQRSNPAERNTEPAEKRSP
ncbi:hypothetical protein SynBMKMC1_00276 [Synechococcus sp. BMK-MC-1]|nr:hypothetical protein SynBMKMC1_00276 [Synechococcus sp. BMK-MC-1]